MSNESLDRAITLSRNGKKLEARSILDAILKVNPQNDIAWLWYADTYPDATNRIRILDECLQHNPDFQVAKKWLVTFRAELEAKQASTAEQALPEFQHSQAEESGGVEGELSEPKSSNPFDQQIDCSGLPCPLPILKTKKAIDELQTGQVLKIIATDPNSVADMQAWTTRTGHTLVTHEQEGEKFIFYIQHK